MWVIEIDAVGGKCYVATGSGDPERTCHLEHAEKYPNEKEARYNAYVFSAKYQRKCNAVQIAQPSAGLDRLSQFHAFSAKYQEIKGY